MSSEVLLLHAGFVILTYDGLEEAVSIIFFASVKFFF